MTDNRPELHLHEEVHDEYLPEEEAEDAPLLPARSHRAGRRGRRLPGCLAVLVALAVVVAGLFYGGSRAYHFVHDHLSGSAPDYSGPGTGRVTFQVQEGEGAAAIGRDLKQAGVVKS